MSSKAANYAKEIVKFANYEEYLKVIKGEIAIGKEYGCQHNFEELIVYPVAGAGFQGGLSGFERLGIKVDQNGNLMFMKVPIAGDQAFLESWAAEKLVEFKRVFDAIKELRSRHVGLYLMRAAANVCKLVYIMRMVSRHMIEPLIRGFDDEMMQCLEDVVGLRLTQEQKTVAGMRAKQGGAGLENRRWHG